MNRSFDIDDPLLTAYALGELDEADHRDVAAAVQASPELQSAVADIRAAAGQLQREFAAEIAATALAQEIVGDRATDPVSPWERADPTKDSAPSPIPSTPIGRTQMIFSLLRSKAVAASLALLVVGGTVAVWVVTYPPLSRSREAAHAAKSEYEMMRYRYDDPNSQVESREGKIAGTKGKGGKGSRGGGGRGNDIRQSMGQIYSELKQLKNLGYVGYADGDDVSLAFPVQGINDELTEGLASPVFRERTGIESYDTIIENSFLLVAGEPLSTFSIDVDTASYSNVRRFINEGRLPPKGAVRIEELINYFTYDYPQPGADEPFAIHVAAADSPWKETHRLVRIGIKGFEVAPGEHPMGNFVFLIDTSGSMDEPNKLPLVKESLRLLVENLPDDDEIALVTYAGSAGLVLDSTPCAQRGVIMAAIDNLDAGGSTNGGQGIQLAYDVARDNFIADGTNRVILCTDGDFNVGMTDRTELIQLITKRAKEGVFLSVMGFGVGNIKDGTMEQLADKGNGNYGYIDSIDEARKLFVEQLTGTLVTIAKDVKIQVEFNPAEVQGYRLIGYENRRLANQDFNDDTKDAGEIGAGHTVTALYEVIPVGVESDVPLPTVDPLKYRSSSESGSEDEVALTTAPLREGEGGKSDGSYMVKGEMLTVKLRYKAPSSDVSELIEVPFTDSGGDWSGADPEYQFASAVAAFGLVLRDSQYRGDATLADVLAWTDEALSRVSDPDPYRLEFRDLISKASQLSAEESDAATE